MPDPDAPSRLFIALWPGSAAQAATLAWQRAQAWPEGAALVEAQKLHVTLHFLGPVAGPARAALLPALDRIDIGRVQIDFDRFETWHGGTAVLTPSATPPTLETLHRQLTDALRALELPLEARPFRPHVTLARRAETPNPVICPPARWIASRFALVESRDGRYRNLATFSARN